MSTFGYFCITNTSRVMTEKQWHLNIHMIIHVIEGPLNFRKKDVKCMRREERNRTVGFSVELHECLNTKDCEI